MGRYVSPVTAYVTIAGQSFQHVDADNAAELETKVRAVIAAIVALAGPGISAIWMDGSSNVAPRKKDGTFVCCVEYTNEEVSLLDASTVQVYCYGGNSQSELDAARTVAYSRATIDGYTNLRDTLLAGSSPAQDKFIGMLVCLSP
jgi:hypothetical protein